MGAFVDGYEVRDITTTIRLEYELIDINPNIPFKPKHSLKVTGRHYTNTATKFWGAVGVWQKENVSAQDMIVNIRNRRIWFRNMSELLMFKLALDGYSD
jgi:hypothetical protein